MSGSRQEHVDSGRDASAAAAASRIALLSPAGVLALALTALVAAGAALAATGYVRFGTPGARAPRPGKAARATGRAAVASSPSPINVRRAAATLETDPARAKLYAENAVGSCLRQAWANAGYVNVFDQYAGNGVVQFSTGTAANPTGSVQARTLISVRVYANGTISGNRALDHWGCRPFKYDPRGGTPAGASTPASAPKGLVKDGPLEVGCRLRGERGYTSFRGEVTLYNPGNNPQTVSSFIVSWGCNGILMSQNEFNGQWSIPPEQDITLTISGPPPAATVCDFAGWNP